MKYGICGILAALCLGGFGCVATPERPARQLMLPELQASREVQARRAAEFRQLTAKVKVRGIGIHLFALRRQNIPLNELLDRIAEFGFNRIYCYLSSEKQLDDFLRDLVVAASRRNLPVEIVLNQRDFYRRATGNKLDRKSVV